MDWKIEVPVQFLDNFFFDGNVNQEATPVDPNQIYLAQQEMDQMNNEEKANYLYEHPTLIQFLTGK